MTWLYALLFKYFAISLCWLSGKSWTHAHRYGRHRRQHYDRCICRDRQPPTPLIAAIRNISGHPVRKCGLFRGCDISQATSTPTMSECSSSSIRRIVQRPSQDRSHTGSYSSFPWDTGSWIGALLYIICHMVGISFFRCSGLPLYRVSWRHRNKCVTEDNAVAVSERLSYVVARNIMNHSLALW